MSNAGSSPALPLPDMKNSWRASFRGAVRFWERRRLVYNAVLVAVVLYWLVATWPHFRPALRLDSLPPMLFLALLANVCYCAAYAVDLPLQQSIFAERWLRWRPVLWIVGTVFAVLLEWYWIGDEIYPYVR